MILRFKPTTFMLFSYFVIFSFFNTSFAKRQNKISNISVSDFELIGGFDLSQQWYAKTFTEGIINGLSHLNNIRLLERSNLEKITNEIALNLSGLVSEESTIEASKLLGADKMIIGNLSKIDRMILVNCRVVDVETGQIIKSFEQKGDLSKIFIIQNKLLKKLINYFSLNRLENISAIKTDVENKDYHILTKIREQVSNFPILALDPARRRNAVKYMMSLSKLKDISERYPMLIEPLNLSAKLYIQLEDFGQASEILKVAQSIQADNQAVLLSQVQLSYLLKNYIKSKQDIKKYLKINPFDANGWYIYGKLCLKTNQSLEAATSFLKSLILGPYIYEAETNLKALLLANNGQYLLEKIAMANNDDGLLAKLYLLYWTKQKSKIKKILDIEKFKYNNFYLTQFLLGKRDLQEQHFSEAIREFRQSIKLNPSFIETHKFLGIALLQNGEISLGKKHLKSYLILADHIDDLDLINSYLSK